MIKPRSTLGDNSIRIVVVTTTEQLLQAFAIRSICIFEEVGLTYEQAFDGNDFQATHVLVYAGDEPIGATRVRWFRDFAKIERTALRLAHRDPRTLRKVAAFIFAHVARKGYATLVTHAEPKYAQLWERLLGFERTSGRPEVRTEGHEPYVELVKRLPPDASAVTLSSEPAVLFRVEGAWDRPGAFEAGGG